MSLLNYLMKAGTYGHFWMKQSLRTQWWAVNDIKEIPTALEDIYFGVHPSKVRKGPKEATEIIDIEAINCLYADIDAHDYEDKSLAAKHVKQLTPKPSVIIDSGGGYHCYWLLDEPFILNTELKRDIASKIQKQWVMYVGGDLAVHDLARILRLPGTMNYKYTPPRPVTEAYSDLNLQYSLTELEDYLPETTNHRAEMTKSVPSTSRPNTLSPEEIVQLALKSSTGDKFRRLYKGINSGYTSASEADEAFCTILAFWTGGDFEKMDIIFRSSDRMRAKWDRQEYRYDTLTKAILQSSDFYRDPNGLLTAGAHDEGNASCTYAKIKDTIAFSDALGWLYFKKDHWESELADGVVTEAIIQTLKERRRAAADANDEELLRATKPAAVHVRNAKSLLQRKISVPLEEFDTSHDELNCQNGVLNLKTGELIKQNNQKRFTYCVPVRYSASASSSEWEDWLYYATGSSQEVVDFLKVAVGYSMTGHTREEIMFYIQGPARAGKGLFTETLINMLGGRPLATEVDIDMFMSKKFGGSNVGFSLASLKATRLIAASESRENEWLNAQRVKRWTGGNIISCAHKYGKEFSYTPQFKIWLTSNYPPQMNAEDAAAWGRLRIVEFPISHLGREDKLLKSKMKTPQMLEGVLKWATEGAIQWYKLGSKGLIAPTQVVEATERAQIDVDWVSAWLEEAVQMTGNEKDRIPSDIYFQEYKDWCDINGVSAKSLRSLNRALRDAGHTVGVVALVGQKTKRCWTGVKVIGYSNGLSAMAGKAIGNGYEE